MVYQKPYTFRAGTYAKAAEVNANFDTVKNFIDDLQTDIADGFASTPAYNKANKNGSATEIFKALEDTSDTNSNSVVINSQLDTVNTALNTRISALEATGTWTAPSYSSSTDLSNTGTIGSSGVIYIQNTLNSSRNITIGSVTLSISPYGNLIIPVKSGTSFDFSNVAVKKLLS